MKIANKLLLVILGSSFQVSAEIFTPNESDLRDLLRASHSQSRLLKLRLLSAQDETIVVKSRIGDIDDAKYMFDAASFAYCSEQQIKDYKGVYSKKLTNNFKPLNVMLNKEYEMQLYIASLAVRKELLVVFRGTSDNRNWDMNLKLWQVPFNNQENVRVHAGFNEFLNIMEDDLLIYLNSLLKQYQDYSIVFAGHSLGGAIATLATAKLPPKLNLPWERIQLYTYGSPRVGNKEFAAFINSKPILSTRVVNNNDPIPKSPYIGYVHIHNELFINGKESIICDTNFFEDPNCSRSLPISFDSKPHFSAWDKTLKMKDC